jgi:single-strand DNA-binding protein
LSESNTLINFTLIKLTVIGNLGRDAIVRDVQGKSVISFSVAHIEKFKDNSGQQKDKTTWVECNHWSERTNLVPYLKKGHQIYVEGQPTIDVYENKDGQKVAGVKLRVTLIQLLSNKSSENHPTSGNSATNAQNQSINNGEDDLPF